MHIIKLLALWAALLLVWGCSSNYDEYSEELIADARRGDPEAQFNLALRYTNAENPNRNFEQAAFWLERSADQDYPDAQHYLGMSYAKGQGVEQNYQKAVTLVQKAASKKGQKDAQYDLGMFYLKGEGLPLDQKEGYFWLSIAAKSGSQAAQQKLDQDTQNLNPQIKEEIRTRVLEWFDKH